jgi:DNA polymerase sigma
MIQSRIAADVCLNTESESTLTTMEWLNFYPDLKTLYLVLKHGLSSLKVDSHLKFHMMDSKSQGIASFSLICLIVRYLQASISTLDRGLYKFT